MKNSKKVSILLLLLALCALILWCIIFVNKKNIETTQQENDNNHTENNIKHENTTGSSEENNIKAPEKEEISAYESIEYENKKYNFKINIPINRTFQEDNKWFTLILSTTKNDNINENLWIKVQELQVEETPESYTQRTIEWLKDLYETYKETNKKNIEINWINGISLTYEMIESWYNLKAQQTVFLKDKKSYVLQYTATKKTFDNYINEINNIVNSFTILN